ncbi:MAG: hypothetical protein IM504_06045 [Microcystis sp. M038S2]|uniref:hypothetical protein n=1 Tax=unclassified Microcystis TaxID=2643300 RepID=UPI00258D45B8|nr:MULTISPECIES: hypothetical protein [unclassified Microcystis]MCA2683091.1 hypothetical protein [Microcystis sp. M046S2]MCA2704456.1 hypothetical protein [Microcystis sp. M038S2]MCA2949539.1 hypothetical protein [Microcystis sp. M109S1]MCA2953741.1 hypothetical protein [Microcystis sp. M112S1]
MELSRDGLECDGRYFYNPLAWCVPQKSIGGAVEVALGNAPYKIADWLKWRYV